MHSLREVARVAKVAPPTLSRLARALDCDSYDALRDLCRREIRRRSISLTEKADALWRSVDQHDKGGATPFVVDQARSALENVERLLNEVDIEELRNAADRLHASRRVVLVGWLSAVGFIQYLDYMSSIAFGDWTAVDMRNSSAASALAELNEKDAVIVITHSPYARRTVEAANLASATGAYVVAITDSMSSPVARVASATFLAPTESPQFFPSHVATLVLIEAIMGMLARRGGPTVRDHVAAAESANNTLGEYW